MHLDQPVVVGRGAVDDDEDEVVVFVELGALVEVLRVLDGERMELEDVAEDSKSASSGRSRSSQKNSPDASSSSTSRG